MHFCRIHRRWQRIAYGCIARLQHRNPEGQVASLGSPGVATETSSELECRMEFEMEHLARRRSAPHWPMCAADIVLPEKKHQSSCLYSEQTAAQLSKNL